VRVELVTEAHHLDRHPVLQAGGGDPGAGMMNSWIGPEPSSISSLRPNGTSSTTSPTTVPASLSSRPSLASPTAPVARGNAQRSDPGWGDSQAGWWVVGRSWGWHRRSS
jgi:hypothetical protein